MIYTTLRHKLPGTLLLLSTVVSAVSVPATSSADVTQTLDWVPYQQLTPQQQQQLAPGSCGAYISPLTGEDTSIDLSQSPLESSSDSSEITEKGGQRKITLVGDVFIKQGYRQLNANSAIYDETDSTITIDGELTLRDPDLLVMADKGVISQQEDTLVIDNATYVIHSANIRGTSQALSKDKHILRMKNGALTYCEPGNNDWVLEGSKITINTETNQGHATNVTIRVRDIPVFYWPYLRFPVGDERQSGFLFPTIASSNGGINVSVPYYFNLAPNYDLTVTPHFIETRGTLLETNTRHLSTKFETDITLAHLSDDKDEITDSDQSLVDNGDITLAEATRNRGNDRWLVNIDQKGGKNSQWFSSINYNEVSDNDYLDDFDGSTLKDSSEVSLKQQITAGYEFTNWHLEIDNTRYQVIDNTVTRPYKQLPQITFDGSYQWDALNINLENEWTRFTHSDSDHGGNNTLIGNRANLKYALGIENEADFGFFSPRIQVRHLSYQLDDNRLASGANDAPSITAPQAVIDTGLFFERPGEKYLQTFEPRLFYFYSDFKDQSNITGDGTNVNFDTSDLTFSYNQLFNDTRFSGGDRIDDANQLAIGLTTRFINQESGLETFSIGIGKLLYFDERRVTLTGVTDTENNSPIAGQMNAHISKKWSASNSFIYNDDNDQIDDNNFTVRYRSKNTLLNMGYRFLRGTPNTEQGEFSSIFPLANNWHFVSHYNYDFTNNRELEQLLGIEYTSCCYKARIAFKRFLDENQFTNNTSAPNYDSGIILEFELLGLGKTGKQFDKLLDDSIDGYEEWNTSY